MSDRTMSCAFFVGLSLALTTVSPTLAQRVSLTDASKPGTESAPLVLNVDTDHVLRTGADHVLGINLNYLRDADANRPSARSLDQALSAMGTRWLRYPGGGKSNYHRWSLPPYERPSPQALGWYAGVPGVRMDFDEYIAHCRAAHAEPYVVVGYEREKETGLSRRQWLENAASWVRYANVIKHDNVRYWEVGNENWDSVKGFSPAQIADVVTEFSRAMKAVDPAIKIGASGNSRAWWSAFLPQASPALDFISLSLYNTYGWKSYDRWLEHPNENLTGPVQEALDSIDQFAQPADRRRLRVIVAETNSKDYLPGGWPDDNSLGHALVTFATLGFLLQEPRVEAAMVWTTRWVHDDDAPNSLFYALGPWNELKPTGWSLTLWGKFVRDDMVLAALDNSPSIFSFASSTHDRSETVVWVLNARKEGVSGLRIRTKPSVSYHHVAISCFSGTGTGDESPQWRVGAKTAVTMDSLANLTLPPLSVTVIRMTAQ